MPLNFNESSSRVIKNIEELRDFSLELKSFLQKQKLPFFLLLSGGLGSGKTTLTKYLLHNLGIKEPVSSPTFIILNQYSVDDGFKINHMDAYRLSWEEDLGLYEELFEGSLNVIEWPERLNFDWKHFPHLRLQISIINENERLIEMR